MWFTRAYAVSTSGKLDDMHLGHHCARWAAHSEYLAQLHMHDLTGQLCNRRLDDGHANALQVHL